MSSDGNTLAKVSREMFQFIDDQLSPPEPGHLCGPESNCDAACADHAHFYDMMCRWNEVITRTEHSSAPAFAGVNAKPNDESAKLVSGRDVHILRLCEKLRLAWDKIEELKSSSPAQLNKEGEERIKTLEKAKNALSSALGDFLSCSKKNHSVITGERMECWQKIYDENK